MPTIKTLFELWEADLLMSQMPKDDDHPVVNSNEPVIGQVAYLPEENRIKIEFFSQEESKET